ncbi:Uridine nucleosidase 1 [Glycine soja]|uniref:Uridine nucleosidase 1 n=1 Tax=Glycine soja TaxID=3848 RepID=A0A0B2S1F3_GLYSO|nr:Uridine nucleosidase 1 [Glycine soja]
MPCVADFVHGKDGLGNTFLPSPKGEKIEKSASEFLVEKVSEYPSEAINGDSTFASKVKRIVILGGAFFALGNVNPAAEANCNYTVWPALVSNGNATLSTSDFKFRTGESHTVSTLATWEGKTWGCTRCSINSAIGSFSCVTGDCGSGNMECSKKDKSPQVAMTVMINVSNNMGGCDFHEVNLESGFNVHSSRWHSWKWL